MRVLPIVLSMVVATTMTAGADARGSAATDPHFRPAEASSAALVAEATQRSPTVRDLAAQLLATDVVAYLRVGPPVLGEGESSIYFLGRSRAQRFLLIRVDGNLPADRQVALVGHELQHAVDMAASSWVTDQYRMQQYFVFTGWKNAYPVSGFETMSALKTERKVGREIVVAERAVGQTHQPPK